MIRWLLGGVGSVLFGGACFVIGLWVTFPADEVMARLSHEVDVNSNGELRLEIGGVAPWWLGVSAHDIQLYSVPRVQTEPPTEGELVFFSERVRLRAALVSLLLRQPRAIGTVQVGSGELDFDVAVQLVEKGPPEPTAVHIAAEGFPIIELMGLMGVSVEGEGTIDVALDLEAPKGMKNATGALRISGADISVSKMDLSKMGIPDLGAIEVTRVDISAEVADGRAKLSSGIVESPLANADVSGEITLRDDLHRSLIRLDVGVDFGDTLEKLASAFAKDALGTDNKYHWTCTGTLNRLPPTCRPVRSRTATASSARGNSTAGVFGQEGPTGRGADEEERRRLRDETIERVRGGRKGGAVPTSATGTANGATRAEPLPEDDLELAPPDDLEADDWDFGEPEVQDEEQ